eukprot:6175493-Pleurochrysis_carterae.AAC.2
MRTNFTNSNIVARMITGDPYTSQPATAMASSERPRSATAGSAAYANDSEGDAAGEADSPLNAVVERVSRSPFSADATAGSEGTAEKQVLSDAGAHRPAASLFTVCAGLIAHAIELNQI